MRMDKLTTNFQQALADAQSLAVGRDHQFIEPVHLMAALLEQEGGTVRGLLTKAGANMNLLRSQLGEALDRLPSVEGAAGEVHVSNELSKVLNVTDKLAQERGDAYISSELFVLAALQSKGDLSRILEQAGAVKGVDRQGDRRHPRRRQGRRPERRRDPPGAREVHDRSHRARRARQARPGHRPRRRDSPHDSGAAAAHEEQSRADRRARRRQDRDRRRPCAAHRQRRGARRAQVEARAVARHRRR